MKHLTAIKNPRQFWLFFDGKEYQAYESLENLQEFHTSADYHVIEYSAYEAVLSDRNLLDESNTKMNETLALLRRFHWGDGTISREQIIEALGKNADSR